MCLFLSSLGFLKHEDMELCLFLLSHGFVKHEDMKLCLFLLSHGLTSGRKSKTVPVASIRGITGVLSLF